MKKISVAFIVFIATLFCWSCTKQVTSYVPVGTPFPYPSAYYFQGVNYADQHKIIAMTDEIMAKIDKGNTQGVVVDSAMLRAMFNNTGNNFDSADLNTSGLNLASLCVPGSTVQSDILSYMDSVGAFSHSVVPGARTVPGVGNSTTEPGVSFLQGGDGFVYRELVKASIMEGILAYQIETIHLKDSINTLMSIPSMQTNWDAAFGYFDVPIDFPTDTTGSNYWGRYSKNLSAALGLDTIIMNNFLIGRAAINNNFILASNVIPTTVDYAAIADANNIIAAFDKLVIGAAIHDLTQAQLKDSVGDPVVARAYLSSSWGFIHSLNYNASLARTNNATTINSILAAYGTNLYDFSYTYQHVDSIKAVIGSLGGITNTAF
jgi:hypothetical protein